MRYPGHSAPVAQLDRALPSEGRGHRFESCRARQFFQRLAFAVKLRGFKTRLMLAMRRSAIARRRREGLRSPQYASADAPEQEIRFAFGTFSVGAVLAGASHATLRYWTFAARWAALASGDRFFGRRVKDAQPDCGLLTRLLLD